MLLLKCKQFFKTPMLVLATILYFGWITSTLLPSLKSDTGHISYSIMNTACVVPVSFVFFLFLSYAFFLKDYKSRTRELIQTSRNGMLANCILGFCVFLALNIILLILYAIVYVSQCIKTLGAIDWQVVLFGIRCCLIYLILVSLFAVLVGMVMSFVKSEVAACGGMLVVCCLFSQFFVSAFCRMPGLNKTLYRLIQLFGLTTRRNHIIEDNDYILSAENVNFQRIFFWIFICITILLYLTVRKRKKGITFCSVGITAVLFVFYMLPNGSSYVDVESSYDAWNEENTYYSEHLNQVGTQENDLSEVPFKITKYVADIRVNRLLKADVEVYVDEPQLDTYTFALRHEYAVSSIEDAYGAKVDYTQEGDRVVVRPDTSKQHEKFVFHYKGASQTYYSTSQAVRLPSYFAYLPFAGERSLYLYISEQDEETGEESILYEGNALEGLGYETAYDVTVHSKQKLFSNLPEKEKNHFVGTSDGITLMGNPFLVKEEIAGASVIHSKVDERYSVRNLEKDSSIVNMRENWKNVISENKLEGKTIFVTDIVHGEDESYRYYGENYLVLSGPYLDGVSTQMEDEN